MSENSSKGVCALAYLLFFIPLLVDSKNQDYKFHANQGLNLFLLNMIVIFGGNLIPFIGPFLVPILGIGIFVLWIMATINALNGLNKPLPLVGKWQLLK